MQSVMPGIIKIFLGSYYDFHPASSCVDLRDGFPEVKLPCPWRKLITHRQLTRSLSVPFMCVSSCFLVGKSNKIKFTFGSVYDDDCSTVKFPHFRGFIWRTSVKSRFSHKKVVKQLFFIMYISKMVTLIFKFTTITYATVAGLAFAAPVLKAEIHE